MHVNWICILEMMPAPSTHCKVDFTLLHVTRYPIASREPVTSLYPASGTLALMALTFWSRTLSAMCAVMAAEGCRYTKPMDKEETKNSTTQSGDNMSAGNVLFNHWIHRVNTTWQNERIHLFCSFISLESCRMRKHYLSVRNTLFWLVGRCPLILYVV